MSERLVDKHIEEIRKSHPEVFGSAGGVEEGEVLPSKPRPTDNITGSEVIIQSSRKPIKIKPPLEATPLQLHRHRADTHTRIAHGTSNAIAHGTGFLDGIVDGLANGAAELLEDGVFLVSKTIYGVKHGWSRGKFQGSQSPVKTTSSPGFLFPKV